MAALVLVASVAELIVLDALALVVAVSDRAGRGGCAGPGCCGG